MTVGNTGPQPSPVQPRVCGSCGPADCIYSFDVSLCLRSTLLPSSSDEAVEEFFSPHQRSSDGSLSHEEDLAKVMELQEVIDKQAREQSQMKERLAALSTHVAELEEDLDTARKDLIKSEEVNTKLQRDVREVSEPTDCRVIIGPNAGVF